MASRHITPVLLLAATLLAQGASAQTPVHPAQLIIPRSDTSQALNGLAMDGAGNLTFLWTNLTTTSTGAFREEAWTRRYSNADVPATPASRLEPTTFSASGGTVVANQRGDVVMTWSRTQGSTTEFILRRTSPVLPTLTLKLKGGADVAVDRNGNFIVVWVASTPSGYRVLGQRYNSDGTTRGPEFNAATSTVGNQSSPSVAMNPNTGEFVVVWEVRATDGTGLGVYGQRFGFATGRQGSEFPIFVPPVSDRPSELQYFAPQVGRATDGGFVVIWRNPHSNGFVGILGQRYNNAGALLGARLAIAEENILDSHPQIAVAPAGNFVVAWDDQGTSPAWFRLFRKNGTPAGPVQVAPPMGGASYNGSGRVTFGWTGTFAYGWTNYNDNGDSGNSISYQRWTSLGN
jgi:hypothetical protein